MIARQLLRYSCVTSWLVLLQSAPAHAGNDDEIFVGNRAAMMGGAVTAIVRDGSSAWYNPAGLGGAERDQLDTSATVYSLRIYSAPGYLSSSSGEQEEGYVREFFSLPSQVAYQRRLAPGVGLGLAYFAPKSSNLLLREQLSMGDPQNGSTWQLALSQTEVQHRFVAAVGFEPANGLRFGVSVIGGYELGTSALSVFGAVQQDGETVRAVTSSELASYGSASLEVGLGAQVDVTPELQLGMFARSPSALLRRTTDLQYSDSRAAAAPGAAPALSAGAYKGSELSGVAFLRAGRFGFGLAYWLGPETLVSAEADVQPALQSRSAAVSRNAVLNARLGVQRQITPWVRAGAGLFTDRSSSPRRSDDISTAGDFYGGTLGVELGERHQLDGHEKALSLAFSTVIALRYAHSNAKVTRVLIDPSPTSGQPFQSALGDLSVHELSLFLGTGLAF